MYRNTIYGSLFENKDRAFYEGYKCTADDNTSIVAVEQFWNLKLHHTSAVWINTNFDLKANHKFVAEIGM